MEARRAGNDKARTSWRVFAESVCGTNHARAGKPGEDAHCWRVDTLSGCLVAAIADGAGSARLGGVAAGIAVETAVDSVLKSLAGGDEDFRRIVRLALHEARRELKQEADRRRGPLREFSTTLIVVLATATHAIVAQVGDGFAVVVDANFQLIGFSQPQNGEFVNETFFLTARDAAKNAVLTTWEGRIAGVAILTDGLQRLALKLPQRRPHAPFFDSLFRTGEAGLSSASLQLTRFLNSPRLAARTDDDVTLLVAWIPSSTRAPDPAGHGRGQTRTPRGSREEAESRWWGRSVLRACWQWILGR